MKRILKRLVTLNSEKRDGLFFLSIGIGSIFTWGNMFYRDIAEFDFEAPIDSWIFDLTLYAFMTLIPITIIMVAIMFGLALLGLFDKENQNGE